jgi:pimeloyl-ACP methyl ester carboxylesterase
MELVRIAARDGVELHGILHLASRSADALQPDAAVFLHGAGGNFYGSALFAGISPILQERGVSLLAINTRGHDLVCTVRTPHGGRRGGAAYETIDDCRHDAHAAVDWLVARGYRNIALMGHSLGALKAVYSQACEPHPAVRSIAAISPPRFSYRAYCSSDRGQEFLAAMREAEELVASGKPLRLIEATVPLPLLITAAGYIDKYGPAERYDVLKVAPRVNCPTLFIFGENELNAGHPAFTGLDELLRQLGPSATARLDVASITGADHFYAGQYFALAERLVNWHAWAGPT